MGSTEYTRDLLPLFNDVFFCALSSYVYLNLKKNCKKAPKGKPVDVSSFMSEKNLRS